MFKIFGVCSGAILSLAIVSIHSSGFPSRLDESARSALAGSRDIDPLRNKCRDVKLHDGCRFGNLEAPITYAIIGDSHAAAIRPAIEKSNLLKDAAGTLYWMRACPFLQGARIVGHENSRQCELFRDDVWRIIESDQNIDTVVLSARWSFALTGWRPESGDLNREWLEDEETDKHSAEESSKVFARSLRRTLDRLNLLGLRTIIVGAVPEPGFDVPNALAMDRYYGRLGLKGVPRYMVQQRAGVTDSFIYEIASEVSGVQFLSIWEGFCDRSWCAVEVNGSPVYYDDDHLSYSGAVQLVAPLINQKAGLNEFVLGNN